MRTFLFNTLYWGMSGVYAIACAILGLIPGRFFLMHAARSYTRFTVLLMKYVAGIRVEVRGTPPKNQPVILAAKHQSWGDGIVLMAKTGDINFVVGDHMLKFPLIGWVLQRMGAIVVNNSGGRKSIEALNDGIARSQAEARPILIYPEGHLTEVGETKPFRSGVFRLYRNLERPVVPVATNLGLYWPQQDWAKNPGTAVIEYLAPIEPGLSKEDFMKTLESRVSARTRELEAEGRS